MIYYNHYTDKLVWTIIKSTFSKKTIGSLIIALLTIVIRIHIDGLLAILLATGLPIVDFLIHITISSVLVIKSQCIYVIVDKFHPEIYQITKYCINNYTPDNLRKWKRMSMLSICLYLFIYFSIVQITSALIRQAILEYIVCYIIIDFYEQGHFTSKIFSRFINKLKFFLTVFYNKIKPSSWSSSIKTSTLNFYSIHRKSILYHEINRIWQQNFTLNRCCLRYPMK